jgi:hypothetical protein
LEEDERILMELPYEQQFSDDICLVCGAEDFTHLEMCPLHPDYDEYRDADEQYIDPLFDFDSDLEG